MTTGVRERPLDPEAEQEVDFGRYVRLVVARWWLVVAGLALGAVVGYAVSLGGSQRFQATATLYLGQPYSASGNVQLSRCRRTRARCARSCTRRASSTRLRRSAKRSPARSAAASRPRPSPGTSRRTGRRRSSQ